MTTTDEERFASIAKGRALLSDGRSIGLRPMYLSEKLKLEQLRKDEDVEGTVLELTVILRPIIEPAVLDTSWGGSIMDTTEEQFFDVFAQWPLITEAAAVDPTNASGSATKPSPRRSRRSAGKPQTSASRSSTKS